LDVTLHSYRSRWGVTAPDPRSAWLKATFRATRTLPLSAVIVQGEADGVSPLNAIGAVSDQSIGPFERVTLREVRHFPQREAPDALATHLLRFLSHVEFTPTTKRCAAANAGHAGDCPMVKFPFSRAVDSAAS
jgi:pimeloyl-ACP methyl ester carboxylesterase